MDDNPRPSTRERGEKAPAWPMRTSSLTIAVVFVLGSCVWAAPALATGTYQVSACNFAPEAVNDSWTWASNDPAQPSHYAEHVNCPYQLGGSGGEADQESGLSTTDALGLTGGAAPDTGAEWAFKATPDTSITGITYERYIGHQFDGFNDWSPALRADGSIVLEETCLDSPQNGETCSVGGPPGTGSEPARITGLSARELSLGIICQAPSEAECVTGATEHKIWATMYGATVTISDPTPPTLGTPSGSSWGAGEAGGFHKGTESVTTSAHDVGGGVQSIVLTADGHAVESYNASCDYTFAQPCPLSTGAQTLVLPTGELTDGTHTLALSATDAAGNQSTVASEQITVENASPPPPVGLSASITHTGGSAFLVTWTDPLGQIAPIIAATYQVCPANGSGPCGTPTPAPAAGPATVTVPGPGTWSLAVWLTNAAWNGSVADAARITLVVPASNPGTVDKDGSTPPKPAIHLSETLHGRDLVVHVSGPTTGRVRISFTGRLAGRVVVLRTTTVALKHGRCKTIFKLGPRTAAHATIQVSAKLDHEPTVTSILHRHPAKHRPVR